MINTPCSESFLVPPSSSSARTSRLIFLSGTALLMVGCHIYWHARFLPLSTTAWVLLALGFLGELTAVSVDKSKAYSPAMVFWSAFFWLQPAATPWIIVSAGFSKALRLARLNLDFYAWGAQLLGALNTLLVPLTLSSLIYNSDSALGRAQVTQLIAFGVLASSYALLQQFFFAYLHSSTASFYSPQQAKSGVFSSVPHALLSWPATALLVAQPALGVLGVQILPSAPPSALPLALLFIALLASVPLLQLAQRAHDTERLERHLQVTDYRLTVERESHSASDQRLCRANQLNQQRNLILDICQNCNDLESLQQMLFALCRSWWQATSTVLFRAVDTRLQPLAWQSPNERLLAAWELLALHEPLVERAYNTHRPTSSIDTSQVEASASSGALTEAYKYAFPWAETGVLYLGCSQALTSVQLEQIDFLIRESAPRWNHLATIACQNDQMQQLQTRHSALSAWTAQLEATLAALPGLSRLDTPATLRAELLRLVPTLVPASRVALHTATDCPPELQSLWEALSANRCALLLNDISHSRFHGISASSQSLLAVPLLERGELLAILVVESPDPQTYSRTDRDVLTILACQAAVVWSNSALHSTLQQAHQDLASSQATLIQAGKLAAVGQLAAGVAHEVNTPLGAIMLGLDGAVRSLSKGEADKASQRLQRAKDAAGKAKDIVSKLLYYAREARQENTSIDINAIISDTLDFLSFHLDKASIALTRHLNPLPPCPGNPNEIQQVLTNLILNARDALRTHSAIRELTITSDFAPDPGQIVIEVSDNGPGFAAELGERIFEPFFTTKEPGQGTGLGLAISREIMRRHKGALTVDSQPGRTTFTLILPASGA